MEKCQEKVKIKMEDLLLMKVLLILEVDWLNLKRPMIVEFLGLIGVN